MGELEAKLTTIISVDKANKFSNSNSFNILNLKLGFYSTSFNNIRTKDYKYYYSNNREIKVAIIIYSSSY